VRNLFLSSSVRKHPKGVVRTLLERDVGASTESRAPPLTGAEAAARVVFATGHGGDADGVENQARERIHLAARVVTWL
jgi:hypothetical protein